MKETITSKKKRHYAVIDKINETIHTNDLPTYNIVVKGKFSLIWAKRVVFT